MIAPRNEILQGHAIDVLSKLPSNYVDVVVTSPPYWGLRSYGEDCITVWDGQVNCEHEWKQREFNLHAGRGDLASGDFIHSKDSIPDRKLSDSFCLKCDAWKGQLGLEPHPQLYVKHILEVFKEVRRVLKLSGSLFLNLGDTYYTKSGSNFQGSTEAYSNQAEKVGIREANSIRGLINDGGWLQPKQKMLIPERVAIALQEQGWILRNTIVWHKVNGMPSSVQDRLKNSWESVYFFVKMPRYFFDLDAVRKPHHKLDDGKRPFLKSNYKSNDDPHYRQQLMKHQGINLNVYGANPGDVWSLTTEPLKEKHYAAFPQKLVRRILEAAAPKQICNQCDKPRIRINTSDNDASASIDRKIIDTQHRMGETSIFRTNANVVEHRTIGWSNCGCDKGFHSALVLDPFCGSGTTMLVAHKLGLDWLGIDLKSDYCKMAETRIESHGKIRLDSYLNSI